MRIEKITYQHRRDFVADMICEGCGARMKLTSGYDYIGFEIDEEYYNAAQKRIADNKAQVRWRFDR